MHRHDRSTKHEKKSHDVARCLVQTGLFIGNAFVPAADNATINLQNPATGEFLASVSAAQVADVDRAVACAREAYQSTWRSTCPGQRRALLNRLADLIERNAKDLASLEAIDAGILYRDSRVVAVPQAAETCQYYAGWADKVDGKSMSISQGIAYTRREPLGVCAAIVPWNSPL